MDKNVLNEILEKIYSAEEITIPEMPDIDLYMEQLLTFLNSRLNPSHRQEKGKILTKTMINNYTKDGLLITPMNKKYNREHIMLLILIYNLKNILSISDIKALFSPILQDISTPDDDIIPLHDIYATFLELKKHQFRGLGDSFTEKINIITEKIESIDNLSNQNIAKLFLTVLMLIAQANASKRLAERIIDDYFADKEIKEQN